MTRMCCMAARTTGGGNSAFPWRTALADVQYTATWPYAQATKHAGRYDRFVEKERAALAKWLGDSGYSNYADPSLSDFGLQNTSEK